MFIVAWLYFVGVAAIWLVVYSRGDSWWPTTVFLFGPRWIVACPLAILLPLALVMRSGRAIVILCASSLIVAGPLMGGRVSWRGITGDREQRGNLRILTCNTGAGNLRPGDLHRFVRETNPDVIFIQESSGPLNEEFRRNGWNTSAGGMFVASKYPIRELGEGLDYRHLGHAGFVNRYAIETPMGELNFYHVHLPTPRDGFEEFINSKRAGPKAIEENIEIRERASAITRQWFGPLDSKAIVAGDFNVVVESAIFRRHWSDLQDAFSECGLGWGYTKFTRRISARIDHVLMGSSWSAKNVWVGPNVGSDHRPVVVDLDWVGGTR